MITEFATGKSTNSLSKYFTSPPSETFGLNGGVTSGNYHYMLFSNL